eukprot:FR741632.1.p1 GENE.FR741632.1~~FR741632.1.p1  ORF type:complete len:161 (+),score=3.81 FR741632.1:75-485(+)
MRQLGPELAAAHRVFQESASDGLSAEVMTTAISAVVPQVSLGESEIVAIKAVVGNVVAGSALSIISGEAHDAVQKIANATKDVVWPNRIDCFRFVIRNAVIPSVAHCMVHNAMSAAASSACIVTDAVNQVSSMCHF